MTTTASPETAPRVEAQGAERYETADLKPLFEHGLTEEQLHRLDVLSYQYDLNKDKYYAEAYDSGEADARVGKASDQNRQQKRSQRAQQHGGMPAYEFSREKQVHDMAVKMGEERALSELHPSVHNELLETFTIEPTGDPKADQARRDELHFALMSVVTMDRRKFRGRAGDDTEKPDVYTLLARNAVKPSADKAGSKQTDQQNDATKSQTDKSDADAAKEEAEKEGKSLDELRSDFAKIAANAFGKPFDLRGGRYNKARDAYNEEVIKSAKAELGDMSELDKDQRNAAAIAYILAEQKKLRDETREHFTSTKTHKLVKWFTTGSKGARIAKGVAFGLIGGATAAALTTTGVVLLAGVGTAGAVATRFTGMYARNDKYREVKDFSMTAEEWQSHTNGRELTVDDFVYGASDHFDADKKEQQKERKKAVAWGLGGLAVGGAFGTLLATNADLIPGDLSLHDRFEKLITPRAEINTPDLSPGDIPDAFDEELQNPNLPDVDAPDVDVDPNLPDVDAPEVVTTPDTLLTDDNGVVAQPEGVDLDPSTGETGDVYFTGAEGTTHATEFAVEDFNRWLDGYTVQRGDSVWHLAEHYLHDQGVTNPSVYEIDTMKDHMVRELQATGHADHHGWLRAGDIIRTS